jgi:heat shock protein HslJ
MVAICLLLLVGCVRGRSELEGTQWRLTEWTLSSLEPREFAITAEFADKQIGGHAGVNSYGGPYVIGSRHAFAVGPLACTEMAGPEPAMRAERAYLALLGQAKAYRVDAGRLTLLDAGGNESLIFEASGIRPQARPGANSNAGSSGTDSTRNGAGRSGAVSDGAP